MAEPNKCDKDTGAILENDMNKNLSTLKKNILFDEHNGRCLVKIKQELFPLKAVQFAAHHMAEEVNTIIDSDSNGGLVVELFLKNKDSGGSIEKVFWKFNESVIGYTVYLTQSERNKELREAFLKKALFQPDNKDPGNHQPG
jgi:hypothetical protein